jgi:ubiquinone/menaquinone biosynthesis C-methylase UbiE
MNFNSKTEKAMEHKRYVHGYSGREAMRLKDQADTLEDIIHHDTLFPKGSLILEAGCGVGAQTRIIAPKNPDSDFVSVDLSEHSMRQAQELIHTLNIRNVRFQQADIYNLPFEDHTFDAVMVCFVLEHMSNPISALNELKRVLKTGGSIVVIEGDHGSTFFYPDSEDAYSAIECQVQLQRLSGGNSNIGRELYPLLHRAGFSEILVSPRMVYVDSSKPGLVEGFIKNTFTAMIEGVREDALQHGIINQSTFDKGIRDLYRTAQSDGVFSYTFFKGFGIKK